MSRLDADDHTARPLLPLRRAGEGGGREAPSRTRSRLAQARQHRLAHHADRRQALCRGTVIAGGDDDREIEVGHHPQALPAIADAAEPSVEPVLRRAVCEIADIPLVAVAPLLIDAEARRDAL